MLGPEAVPAFAMYEALPWGSSKTRALRAAAAMVLTEMDCRLFDAPVKVCGQDERQRNKVRPLALGVLGKHA